MTAEPSEISLRELRPADVAGLCRLLGSVFDAEYAKQGIDMAGARRQYALVAWANLILRPLGLDFFQVVVARRDDAVIGTLASFPVEPGLWYQGFGAVDESCRGAGVYKQLIRVALEAVARRGGRVGGGEIEVSNRGALRPYHEVFGCDVLPAARIYLVPTERAAIPSPSAALAMTPVRRLDAVPDAAAVQARFRGGFLLENEIDRGFVGTALRWLLPPITARSFLVGGRERPAAFVRVRTHWPAKIRAFDVVHCYGELPAPGTVRDVLLTVIGRHADGGAPPIRVYCHEGDAVEQACLALGFQLFAEVFPVRTDVAAALERTDDRGRLQPGLAGREEAIS